MKGIKSKFSSRCTFLSFGSQERWLSLGVPSPLLETSLQSRRWAAGKLLRLHLHLQPPSITPITSWVPPLVRSTVAQYVICFNHPVAPPACPPPQHLWKNCLPIVKDRKAWCAAVLVVTKTWTQLSDWTTGSGWIHISFPFLLPWAPNPNSGNLN